MNNYNTKYHNCQQITAESDVNGGRYEFDLERFIRYNNDRDYRYIHNGNDDFKILLAGFTRYV